MEAKWTVRVYDAMKNQVVAETDFSTEEDADHAVYLVRSAGGQALAIRPPYPTPLPCPAFDGMFSE